jgi:hypothetical protein
MSRVVAAGGAGGGGKPPPLSRSGGGHHKGQVAMWPSHPLELGRGVNDTWNSFQRANKGRSVTTAEWKAAQLVLWAEHEKMAGLQQLQHQQQMQLKQLQHHHHHHHYERPAAAERERLSAMEGGGVTLWAVGLTLWVVGLTARAVRTAAPMSAPRTAQATCTRTTRPTTPLSALPKRSTAVASRRFSMTRRGFIRQA